MDVVSPQKSWCENTIQRTGYSEPRIPKYDVRLHYASERLSFSLRTKSNAGALRAAQSATQRLEDYWLDPRLQDMDIPAIHMVKANHEDDSSPVIPEAVENYLRINGNDDRIFIRTAQRNGNYVAKLLGNRPITSYSTSEAAQFRDWCLGKGMNINSVKRVFASLRSIINLNIREYGLDCSNAFSGTYMPDMLDAPKRKSANNLYQLFVFVRHKDVLAQSIFISEYDYVMKEEQTEPSRNIQITQMTTEIQPVTSI